MRQLTLTKPEVHRSQLLVADVQGGFEGALRIASMLRARRYRVLRMEVDVEGCAGFARVSVELDLDRAAAPLLLARLERMPPVVSAGLGPVSRRPG